MTDVSTHDAALADHDALIILTRQMAEAVDRLQALTGARPRVERGRLPMEHAADAAVIRAYLCARRQRSRYLPAELFGEPAWDILLDLYAAAREGKLVCIKSACIASAVPPTTALRWLNKLVDRGLIDRSGDASDGRRAYVKLSDAGRGAVDRWLRETFEDSLLSDRSKRRQAAKVLAGGHQHQVSANFY